MLIKMLIKNACKSDWVLKLIKRCFFQSTLPVLYISESCIEMNINLIFVFTLFYGASKGFMKTFNAFVKPFVAPQRSVEIKI